MTRKLKVFGGCFDGRHRLIVAASSKKAAVEAINAAGQLLSLYHFSEYSSETGNAKEIEIAMSKPGAVFSTDIRRQFDEDYKELVAEK